MREVIGDLWAAKMADRVVDARGVPTNGIVKPNGQAVMGAGVAKQAADRWSLLPELLGDRLKYYGEGTYAVWPDPGGQAVVCFQTKRHYRDLSDLALIEQSAVELVRLTKLWAWKTVALPRVGAGLGGLAWPDVKAVLEPLLDDRFIVVSHQPAPSAGMEGE